MRVDDREDFGHYTVLVVEDETAIREGIAAFLEKRPARFKGR